jgi:membrane protein implicated in regulation of membrane protease activity
MMWVWLGVFVVMVLVEASTSVSLTSIWFAIGALAGMAMAAFGAPVWAQIICCVAIGMVTIALLRPYVKKKMEPKIVKSGLEGIIGKKATAIEEVTTTSGAVKLEGKEWNARTPQGSIAAGLECYVHKMDGTKLIVSDAIPAENNI